jgi:hypothetical protein
VKSNEFSDVFSPTARWLKTPGSLVISVRTDAYQAGALYAYTFTIQNPSCNNDAVPVTISSTPVCLNAASADGVNRSMVLDAAPDHNSPMRVDPLTLDSTAWQSNPYPGAPVNTYTVTFNTTVDLVEGTTITIHNLLGTVTETKSMRGVIGSDDGEFDAPNGTLKVTLSETKHAFKTHYLTFNLANPTYCNAGGRDLNISVDIDCSLPSSVRAIRDVTKLGQGIVYKKDEESAPFAVRCPQWQETSVTQSTSNPCMENRLKVSLMLNVPMKSGVNITMVGFKNTRTYGAMDLAVDGPPRRPSRRDLSGSAVRSGNWKEEDNWEKKERRKWEKGSVERTGNWNNITGRMVVQLSSTVAAGQAVEFSFVVINPNKNMPKLAPIDLYADICATPGGDVMVRGVVNQTDDGVVFVKNTTFRINNIGQSTTWPGTLNTITLTLLANVPLFDAELHCPVTITVSPLRNAMCNTRFIALASPTEGKGEGKKSGKREMANAVSPLLEYALLDRKGGGDTDDDRGCQDAPHRSSKRGWRCASWNSELEQVALDVIMPLDQHGTVLSFEIRNPVDAQPSPRINIWASGVDIMPEEMAKQTAKLADSPYDTPKRLGGSDAGAMFDSEDRDVEPLKVVSPSFITRDISQTSNYPGALNTIQVSIRANIDLTVGSVVTISVLNSQDGTLARKTGSIPLKDLAVLTRDVGHKHDRNGDSVVSNRDGKESKGSKDLSLADDAALFTAQFMAAGRGPRAWPRQGQGRWPGRCRWHGQGPRPVG